ncbi:MAG: immunoglobulin domain-containing protein [Phycisphaerae bacterium]
MSVSYPSVRAAVGTLSGLAALSAASAFGQTSTTSDATRRIERPVVLERLDRLHVTTLGKIIEAPRYDGGGIAGACTGTSSWTDANFGGGSFVLQAGFAEGEVAAVSYTLPASTFPIRIDLLEWIIAQQNTTTQTVTQWSVLVWDGVPNAGTLLVTYSSDDVILPHVRMAQGTNGTNVQVSVDPQDPEQIIINNVSGSNTFTIGFRIDQHNEQTQNPCLSAPPANRNAFPTTDTSGLASAASNWLFGLNCGPFGCPANGGWARFSQLPGFCRPSGDWVMRATWTSIAPDCQDQVGACCMPNETCEIRTADSCQSGGGTYQGDNVTCGQVSCLRLGACCLANGTCIEVSPTQCAQQGGAYQGDNTGCPGTNCPQPTGACCFEETGGCVPGLTEADCLNAGGVFRGIGVSCVGLVCFPVGACCLPSGACVADQSPEQCSAQNGVFQGHQTTCGGVNCPQPQGACCFTSGFCLVLTSADCGTAGGSWAGMGTNCSANIREQPTNQAACVGGSAVFSVTGCGNPTPTYQWRQNGVNVPGATNRMLTINPVMPGSAGTYDVVVTSGGSSVTSNPAMLTVSQSCDANCDGLVNNFDIDAFVLALVDGEPGWSAQYPCSFLCANDTNSDGAVNNFDIDPFVACLVGGP